MALSAKYFIISPNGTYIDWSWRIPGFSIDDKEVAIYGGAGTDNVYVAPGSSFDFSDAGSGNDVLYLTGNLADYTQSIDQNTGLYTLTRSVGGKTEVIKFTVGFDADVVYFADGHINLQLDLTQPSGSPLQDPNTGAFRKLQVTDKLAGGTPADPFAAVTSADSQPTRIYVFDSTGFDVPLLPVAGEASVVYGGSGVDRVYVNAGTQVDFSDAGAGDDVIYLTGNFSEYAQTIDQDTGTYTLTRTVDGKTEMVKLTSSFDADKLYFADGHLAVQMDLVQLTGRPLQDQDTGIFRPIEFGDLIGDGTPKGNPTTEVIDLTIIDDSGINTITASGAATDDTTPTVQGKLTEALKSGESLVIYRSDNDGAFVKVATLTEGSGVNTTNWTWTDAGLDNGSSYSYKAQVENAAGSGPESSTFNIRIDTTAPATTVTIDSISLDSGDAGDFITDDGDGIWVYATLSTPLNDGELLLYSNNNGATWQNVTSSVNGTEVIVNDTALRSTNTVQFVVTDGANFGTPASQKIIIDTTAPTQTINILSITNDTGAADFITSDNNGLTVTAKLSAALNTGEILQYSNNNGATWTNVTASITNGTDVNVVDTALASTNTVVFRVSDGAGYSAEKSQLITIDTSVPTAPLINAITGDDAVKLSEATAGITISGKGEAGATVTLSFSSGITLAGGNSALVDAAGNWSVNVTTADIAAMGQDLETVSASQADKAGNVSGTTTRPFTIDTEAPTALTYTPADNVSNAAPGANLVVIFNENVFKGTGNVRIVNDTDGTTTTIAISSTEITVADNRLTINPNDNLLQGKSYHVEIDAGALVDDAGNIYTGISNSTTWNFGVGDPSIEINSIAGDDIVNALENASPITVSGTVFSSVSGVLAALKPGDFTVVLTPQTGPAINVAVTNYNTSTGEWSGTIPANTFDPASTTVANMVYAVNASFLGSDGVALGYNASTTSQVAVDTVIAGKTVTITGITDDSGTTGDFITNDNTGLTISAKLSAALVSGEILQYSKNGGATWTDITSSVSGDVVSHTDNLLTSTTTVSFRVADAAGNAGAPASQKITIDTTAPTQTINILSITNDTGAADFITSDNNGLTVTAKLSAALNTGEILQYSNNNGATWTNVTASITNGTDVNVVDTALTSTNTVVFRVSDGANFSTEAKQLVTIDTTGPTNTFTGAVYDAQANTITLYGTNMNTLLQNPAAQYGVTDIKGQLDWNKFSWDIDSDSTGTDIGFSGNISSVKVNSATEMTITVASSYANTILESLGNYMTNGSNVFDAIDISAGFSRDAAGNAATTDAASNLNIGIDLGTYGNLIAPVQVEGKNYYFWDRSGDGIAYGTQAGGSAYATDYMSTDWLEQTFFGGSTGTVITDTNRTWTMNGMTVRLPSYGSTVNGSGVANDYGNQPGTAATNTPYYQTTANSNATYDGLLAIWDQFNGTGTGTLLNGAPPAWGNVNLLAATPGSNGRTYLNLGNGNVFTGPDDWTPMVAVEVVSSSFGVAPTKPGPLNLADADDTGSSITDNITKNTSGLTISGNAQWDTTVKIFDDINSNGVIDTNELLATGTSAQFATGIDISLTTQGAHNIKAIASNDWGNSPVSDTLTITVDTTAPVLNTVAIASATGIQNSTLNAGDVVTLNVTFNDTVTVTGAPQLQLNIGGTLVNASYASGSGSKTLTFNYTILAGQNDANGISINANSLNLNGGTITDVAGNAATITHAVVADNAGYKVDTTPPTKPGQPDLAAADDTGLLNTDNITSQSSNLTFTGSADAGSTVTLFRDIDGDGIVDSGEILGSVVAAAGNTWSIDATLVANATHSIKAISTDAAGNTSQVSTATSVTIDTLAPTSTLKFTGISTDTGTVGDYITSDRTLTVSGNINNGTTPLPTGEIVQISRDGINWVAATISADRKTWSYVDPTVNLTDPTYRVRIMDSAGNVSGVVSRTVDVKQTTEYAVTAPTASVMEDTLVGGVPTGSQFTFEVTRSNVTSSAGNVEFTLGGAKYGTLANGGDYIFTSATIDGSFVSGAVTVNADGSGGTINFAANQVKATLLFTAQADLTVEQIEKVRLTLTDAFTNSPVEVSEITKSVAEVSIIDNESVSYDIVAAKTNVQEGVDTTISYTITRSGDPTVAGTVGILLSGTTVAGADYTNAVAGTISYDTVKHTGVVSFAPNETTKTITINLTNDEAVEATENLQVILQNPLANGKAAFIGTKYLANTNILDNNNITYSISTAANVNEDAGTITYRITRTGNTTGTSTVDFNTTSGSTATAGSATWAGTTDYEYKDITVTFAPNDTFKDVTVALRNDTVAEDNETVIGVISNPMVGTTRTGTIATASATSNIIDNDGMRWTVTGGQETRENDPDGITTFTVTRTGNTTVTGYIDITTWDAVGSATSGSDYVAKSTRLTFDPNETSQSFDVNLINGLNDYEATEGLAVKLTTVTAGHVLEDGGVAYNKILDDEANTWSLKVVDDAYENEGTVTFLISRTYATNTGVINFYTYNGTADGDPVLNAKDYQSQNINVTFAPNQLTREIQVKISNELALEGNETFMADLKLVNANDIIASRAVAAVIYDDDNTHWNISTSSAGTDEGQYAFVTVTRSGDITNPASIRLNVSNGTATEGATADFVLADYGLDPLLNFVSGEASKTVKFLINKDTANEEGREDFLVEIASPSAGVLDSTAVRPVINASGNSGTSGQFNNWSIRAVSEYVYEQAGTVAYTVSRTGNLDVATTVNFSTSGTTTKGSDYVNADQTLTFAIGEATKTVLVTLNNDGATPERGADDASGVPVGYETIDAKLTEIAGTNKVDVFTNSTATVKVVDQGDMLWFLTSPLNTYEQWGLTSFTVYRLGDLQAAAITVDTASYSAVAGTDFTALTAPNTTLNFAAGEDRKTVYVKVIDDKDNEGLYEDVLVTISNPTKGAVAGVTQYGRGRFVARITDEDSLSQGAIASLGNDKIDNGLLTTTTFINLLAGNDSYIGGSSADYVEGGAGADTLNGGGGTDELRYDGSLAGVNVNLQLTTAQKGGDAEGDIISNFESIRGSQYNDILRSLLTGGGALLGLGGDDTIYVDSGYGYGGHGNDTLHGSAVADTLRGDSANYAYQADATSGSGVAGDDLMYGYGGNDNMAAHDGMDTLHGGDGNDWMFGGNGNDVFVFGEAKAGITLDTMGDDTIADFLGGSDKIQLENYIFTSLATTGTLAAANFKSGTALSGQAPTPADSNDFILYNTSTGELFYDRDGNGTTYSADRFAILTDAPIISAADFVVI